MIPALWRSIQANEIVYWSQLSAVHARPGGLFFLHASYPRPPVNSVRAVRVAPGQELAFALAARRFFARRGYAAQMQIDPWVASDPLRATLSRAGWLRTHDIAVMAAPPAVHRIERSPELSIHVAAPDEMVVWLRILARCFDLPEEPSLLAALQRGFAQGTATSYLGQWNGEPAACAQLLTVEGVGGIYAVGVLPAFRRRGIARALVAYLMQMAQATCEHLCLQAVAESEAERLYRSLGFQRLFVQESYHLPEVATKYQTG